MWWYWMESPHKILMEVYKIDNELVEKQVSIYSLFYLLSIPLNKRRLLIYLSGRFFVICKYVKIY